MAHVQGVSEDENIGVKIVVAESKGENLKVPDDSHPEKQSEGETKETLHKDKELVKSDFTSSKESSYHAIPLYCFHLVLTQSFF